MSIIIPSNNIYNIKYNNINNNAITGISYTNTDMGFEPANIFSGSLNFYKKNGNVYEYSINNTENDNIVNKKVVSDRGGADTFLCVELKILSQEMTLLYEDAVLLIDSFSQVFITNNADDNTFEEKTRYYGKAIPTWNKIKTFEEFINESKAFSMCYTVNCKMINDKTFEYHLFIRFPLELVELSSTDTSGNTTIIKKSNTLNATLTLTKNIIKQYTNYQFRGNQAQINYTLNQNSLSRDYSDISNYLMSKYAKGKETAIITCAITDYYDDNYGKIISPNDNNKKSIFQIGNVVLPYKKTIYGDEPLSINTEYHTAKRFIVIGVKLKMDGALSQELTLLEDSAIYK